MENKTEKTAYIHPYYCDATNKKVKPECSI